MADNQMLDPVEEKVLNRIRENLGYNFLFLTKHPEVYYSGCWPGNCWLGVTATTQDELRLASLIFSEMKNERNIRFVSIEPILEQIDLGEAAILDWLIIGAETGNRKDKIIPQKKWIDALAYLYPRTFMKDSLIPIWGDNLMREVPRRGNG